MAIIDSLKKSQDLASLPHVAGKVLKMIRNSDTEIQSIAKVIEADPILTMKLLRVANSPIFATRSEITSVQHALMLLGIKRVSNIVLSVSIYSKFFINSHKEAALLMERFFMHSYLTGALSKALTYALRKQFDDNEFVGGLLHDIGKMAMLQVHPKEYAVVRKIIRRDGLNDLKAEKEVFGENHIEVGQSIAHLWKLPEEIMRVITYYRAPNKNDKYKELVATVSFADLYVSKRANRIGKEDDETHKIIKKFPGWKVLCDSYPELLRVDPKQLMKVLDHTLKVAPDSFRMFK
jgi:putative nucleotidyltransferase with HDIG domain